MFINMDLFVKSIVCCLASINKLTGRDCWNIKTELKILTFYLKKLNVDLCRAIEDMNTYRLICVVAKKYE